MLNATFRPISQWPGKRTPSHNRKRSQFKAGYNRTLDDLEREIGHLRGKEIIVQVHLEPRDIRNDGWPKSSARPKEPGVVVTFRSSKGPLRFACDTYDSWEDNLRAIGLTMEALRAVGRYGATQGAEQYRGFAQIAAPEPAPAMTEAEARAYLRQWGGNGGSILDAYREAARMLHPDRTTGHHEQFVRLQEAKRVLGIMKNSTQVEAPRPELIEIAERARAAARLPGVVGLYDYETRSSPYGPGRYGLEYRVLLPQSKRPAERGVIFETGNLLECLELTRLAMEEFRNLRNLASLP